MPHLGPPKCRPILLRSILGRFGDPGFSKKALLATPSRPETSKKGGTSSYGGGPVAALKATCAPKGHREPLLSISEPFGSHLGHIGHQFGTMSGAFGHHFLQSHSPSENDPSSPQTHKPTNPQSHNPQSTNPRSHNPQSHFSQSHKPTSKK